MTRFTAQRRATRLLFVASLAMSALFFEGVSRFIMERMFHYPRIYREDPYTSFALIPGKTERHTSREFRVTYRINEQGFRGRTVQLPKPAGTQHLLMLGDSFVFGMGVDEGEDVSSRLRERYELETDERIEVINAGFASGKSPDDAHAFLVSERGRVLDPDIVIESVFVRNDLRDVEEHTWVEQDADGFPLKVRSETDFPNALSARGPIPYYKSQPILSRLASVQLLMRAHFAFFALPRRNRMILEEQADAGVPDTTKLNRALTGLYQSATAQGVRFLVAVIPTRDQVLHRPDAYFDLLIQKVTDHLSVSGIPYIVLDAARTGLTGEDYWPEDSHWKPSGHRKVAGALFRAIEARKQEPSR